MAAGRTNCPPSVGFGSVALAALLCVPLMACAATPGPAVQPATTGEPGVAPPPGADALVEPVPPEVAPPGPSRGGARLIEYTPVSLVEREGNVIEMVEDLVIEEHANDRRYDFDDAVELVVDEQGRIYVHDSDRFRIVVYGPDGGFERAYGGAGEMAPFRHGWIAVSGDKLAISTGNKITVWTLDGRHLYDRSLMSRAFSRDLQGTIDGKLVGSFRMLDHDGEPWFSVENISLDADSAFTYGAVSRRAGAATPRARPGFAATRTGEVYLTRGDEYVVQGFSADGTARWIVHVDGSRGEAAAGAAAPPPALAVPRSTRGGLGRGNPLRVDGRGNLYVFPYVDESWDRDVVPVDVYSAAGDRVFAGFIQDRSWMRAKDDAVYGIEVDGDSGRQRIVRYRLRAPFLRDNR